MAKTGHPIGRPHPHGRGFASLLAKLCMCAHHHPKAPTKKLTWHCLEQEGGNKTVPCIQYTFGLGLNLVVHVATGIVVVLQKMNVYAVQHVYLSQFMVGSWSMVVDLSIWVKDSKRGQAVGPGTNACRMHGCIQMPISWHGVISPSPEMRWFWCWIMLYLSCP